MKNQVFPKHQSSLVDIDANVLALLLYLIPAILNFVPNVGLLASWFLPLLVYLLEKQSRFVKFHAVQSFLLNLIGSCINIVVTIIGMLVLASGFLSNEVSNIIDGFSTVVIIKLMIMIVISIYAIIAMCKAYKNRQYQIPIIGNIAVKLSGIDE